MSPLAQPYSRRMSCFDWPGIFIPAGRRTRLRLPDTHGRLLSLLCQRRNLTGKTFRKRRKSVSLQPSCESDAHGLSTFFCSALLRVEDLVRHRRIVWENKKKNGRVTVSPNANTSPWAPFVSRLRVLVLHGMRNTFAQVSPHAKLAIPGFSRIA